MLALCAIGLVTHLTVSRNVSSAAIAVGLDCLVNGATKGDVTAYQIRPAELAFVASDSSRLCGDWVLRGGWIDINDMTCARILRMLNSKAPVVYQFKHGQGTRTIVVVHARAGYFLIAEKMLTLKRR